jgi:light-regulated signal transduction histidine kinase (bacteriophytochrome)
MKKLFKNIKTSKKLIELHKGKFRVESTTGTGSTFQFTIYKNKNNETETKLRTCH